MKLNNDQNHIPNMKKALQFLTKTTWQHRKMTTCWIAIIFNILFFLKTAEAQLSVTLQAQSPLCGGFSTGVITAIASGGTAPYSYLWSTGATTNPITNLPTGTYSVTVTSSTGVTGTATTTLSAPPPLTAVISVTNCNIPGSIMATVSGGVSPYMYTWNNGATTPTISNLGPGEYCVTIMDSNNCGYAACQTISPALNVQVNTSPVICGNLVGGTATALPNGGDPPFTYQWSNGGTTATLMNLSPGMYNVTVTGNNGCSATGSGTVGITAGNFSVDLNVTQPTCAGSSTGSIATTVNGGAQPLIFAWSSGQSTQNISNLTAGQFTLTVTDALSCSAVNTASLTYQSNVSVVLNATNPTCGGANNGSVSALVNNGVAPYAYLWSNGASTQTISNLGAGTYSVTVSDNLNCSKTATATLTAPPSFSVSVSVTNASHCGIADGAVLAVLGSGGTPPFSYQWNNGSTSFGQNGLLAGTYTVTVTSFQGCTASASGTVTEPQNLNISLSGSSHVCGSNNDGLLTASVTYGTLPYTFAWSNGGNTQTIANLSPGTYTVTVTSSQGCTGSATKVITGIPAIIVNVSVDNVKCFGTNSGKITVTASGGAPPLNYLWSNGATTQSLNNVGAGSYTLTLTDNVSCSKVQTVTVTQPGALNINFNTSGGSCGSTGFATAVVAGGTLPYTYFWNNGGNTQTISNLPPGNYSVTVTDANNCSASSNTAIAAYPLTNLVVSSTNTTCNGTTDGTATATVTGGTPPFQYLWNSNQTSPVISNLSPSIYIVTVTDANGCTQAGSATVLLGFGLNVSIDASIFICPGEFGSATANASGGVSPYTWLWSNNQTTQTVADLVPASYTVTATDVSGCFGAASISLLPGGGFSVGSTIENASCFEAEDGSIALNVAGGTLPYAYIWDTGETTSTISGLPAGNYTATVSDSTECVVIQTVTVTEPPLLVVNLDVFNGNCNSLGAVSALPSGGTLPFQYLWSTGATTQSILNLLPGTYFLTVTDAHDCAVTDSAVIDEIPLPICFIELTQNISSIGGNDGQLTAVIESGTAPFTYSWSNGQSTQSITGLAAGFYEVTISDANACQTICNFTLYNPAKVGDFVWLDTDEDGIQDANESGLSGVSVTIKGTDVYGNLVDQNTTTGANGMYMFLMVPGSYKITFAQPTGHAPSPSNQGNNDEIDSDANVFTGMSPVFTLASGEENLTIDAGFYVAPPCDNVTVPGTICCDQTLCGPGVDPAPLTQLTPPSGGAGNLEFLWMFTTVPGPFTPNGWTAIDTATGPNFDPGPLYETTFFIRCVRRENCIEFLESNIVTITVDTVAVAEINGPQGGCVNTPIDFTATNNGPGATYAWNFGDGTPATATTQSVPGVSWSGFGLKTITLSVTRNGCTSTDVHLIYITNLPSFCGNALVIDANAVNRTAVAVDWYYGKVDSIQRTYTVEWAWENDDFKLIDVEIDSVEVDSFLHYTAVHEQAIRGRNFYRVTLTDSDGTVVVSNIAEVKVIGDFNFVHVYPNPFSDFLTVELIERFNDARITFEMVSVEGRVLDVYEAPAEGFKMQIPTGKLPEGMYFLLVKYDGKPQKIFKLVK